MKKKSFKMIQKSLLLLLFILLSACGKPDFIDSKGNNGKFSDFHGRWLVINYWAVWCKPCIEEVPELNRLAIQEKKRVVVLGVDFTQSKNEKLEQSIEKLGIEFPVLTQDPSQLLDYDIPRVLPTTLIFNPQGKLHRTLLGPQTVASLLQAMTNKKNPSTL
jgi:thiol-disulfide isomerase/thioredoxin